MAKTLPWLICAVVLLAATSALAHKLKVFALVDGDHIVGSAYFVGGAKATRATITVVDREGNELARLVPDAEGEFRHSPKERIDHVIVVDSGDGHVARWTIPADALPAGLGATSEEPPAGPLAASPPPREPEKEEPRRPVANEPVHDEVLASLIEQSVARQLRPLREQLDAHDSRVRLQDILGGIGYITGLAGLGLWWFAGRRERP